MTPLRESRRRDELLYVVLIPFLQTFPALHLHRTMRIDLCAVLINAFEQPCDLLEYRAEDLFGVHSTFVASVELISLEGFGFLQRGHRRVFAAALLNSIFDCPDCPCSAEVFQVETNVSFGQIGMRLNFLRFCKIRLAL